jgi:hypothetical protein
MDRSVVKRVWEVTEPLITHEGLEIVDIDYQLEGRGMMLRFYLDRAEGGVTLDDLAPLSRRIGDVLDVHDVIPARYVLEVSSPGINALRPIISAAIGQRPHRPCHWPGGNRLSDLQRRGRWNVGYVRMQFICSTTSPTNYDIALRMHAEDNGIETR